MTSSGQGAQDGGAEKREHGVAVSFIGLALIVVDLLVIFFAPAAFRLGRQGVFIVLIVVLAIAGLILVGLGRRLRKKST